MKIPENKRNFASDNNSGVHPRVFEEMIQVNQGHVPAYGDDPVTEETQTLFRKHFGESTRVFPVFNGTGANVVGLKLLTETYHAVLCPESAHIYSNECGAPESSTHCKLIPVSTPNGKLTPELLVPFLEGKGDCHHVQPKVISITQCTELGTLYSLEELRTLSQFARENDLFLHMDGARICNAVAALGCTFKEGTTDVGVDVLSFGGTKNGLMGAEAVVLLAPDRLPRKPEDTLFFRKQNMQLSSKMRFNSAQLNALLRDRLWLENAQHSNQMAQSLAKKLQPYEAEVTIEQEVQCNAIFAKIPRRWIQKLSEHFYFYTWKRDLASSDREARDHVRIMTAFDTTPEDVEQFISALEKTREHFSS